MAALSGFGEQLRRLREAKGWTQAELAEKAGLHQFGVAKIEQGNREPNWTTVLSLASALGVTCEAFTVTDKLTTPAKRTPGRPAKSKPIRTPRKK